MALLEKLRENRSRILEIADQLIRLVKWVLGYGFESGRI